MTKLRCWVCGSDEAEEVAEDLDYGYKDYKVIVQGVKVTRCNQCGEGILDGEELSRMHELCKRLYQLDESERPSVANMSDF